MKRLLLYRILVFIIHGETKSTYDNNKFKISAPTWNNEFELPDGSYSISNIQDYFESILKKHGEDIDKPSVQIYVNKIENRVTFKIKNVCSLEFLASETMKLLGSTQNKITKDKSGENVLHLEMAEVILVHCNIVNNDYQQNSRVLYTFGSLLEISPTNHIFLKTFNSEYDEIMLWFTDQNSQPLEIEDRINLIMAIKEIKLRLVPRRDSYF